jgi:hypothetical protein
VWHWNLAGNATLLHQGRIWPPAHLLGAALAGIAAVKGFGWVRERWGRVVAGGLAAVVLGAGVASPALASAQLTQVIHDRKAGFLYGDPDVGSGSFVRRAASFLGPDNSVFVDGVFAKSGSPEVDTSTSNDLAFLLFEFSGCRLAAYDDPRLNHNDLRIRFADEAARWDAAQPFDADYEVLHEGDSRASGQDVLASGSYGGQSWVLIEAPAP